MKKKNKHLTKTQLILLFIGFVAYVFSGGRWNLSVTAWIWPFAFLYYSRRTENVRQFLPLAAALCAGHVIKWLNVLDMGYLADGALCLLWSLCWIVPFLADRLLAQKLPGVFLRSLIFPAVFTSVEVLQTFLPTNSFGMTAYTQEGFLPLMQITSVTGSFGLSFLIFWFGTVLLTAVEKRPGWKRIAAVYLAVTVAVLGFGCIRLATAPAAGNTVRVAGVICPYFEKYGDGSYEVFPYEETERYLTDEARRAAEGGAEIACWNEEAFAIDDADEAALLEKAKELAGNYGMIMILGYETADTDGSEDGLSVNKSVIVLPDGSVTEYVKTKLVPLAEDGYVKGPGLIPTVATDKGILSNVICFDETYPGFIHGMGAQTQERFRDTDILFVPSWDWNSVKNAHSRMAAFRAIENGEAVVKPTYDGISVAVDPYGRELARSDTADTGFDTVWFADVPAAGVRTAYAALGTWIDTAFCVFGVLAVPGGIIMRRKNRTD